MLLSFDRMNCKTQQPIRRLYALVIRQEQFYNVSLHKTSCLLQRKSVEKSQLFRYSIQSSSFILVVAIVFLDSFHFQDAARVAETVLSCGYQFEIGKIVYNKFKSVVSYTTSEIPIFSINSISTAPKLSVYDSLDADVIQSYVEYSLSSLIYYTMKENACSEQSSRMTAMDGASKNAGEMIDKLSLTFNRTRQEIGRASCRERV